MTRDEFGGVAVEDAPEGLVEAGNIDLGNRPVVKNSDGSVSTVLSKSFNFDGIETLLPTIRDDGKKLSDDEAVALYRSTGKHLGKFSSPESATAYALKLHDDQAARYAPARDEFGGVPVPTDEFGGVLVGEDLSRFLPHAPVDYGGVPVAHQVDFKPATLDFSKVEISPYQRADLAVGGKATTGMESGSDFLSAVASDPAGFIKTLPGDVLRVAAGVGDVARGSAADLVSQIAGQPEYGGNIAAMESPDETLPVDRFISSASASSPALATTAKVGQSVARLSPLAGAGALPAWAGRLLAAGFSAQMISQAPELARQMGDELGKPPADRDADKLTTLMSDAIQTGIFAPLAGASAAHGTETAARVEAKLSPNRFWAQQIAKQLKEAELPSLSAVPAPESPLTIAAQMEALQAGRKPAVMITPGETAPRVPPGFEKLATASGTFIFDPAQTSAEAIKTAVADGRIGSVLGYGSDVKPPGAEMVLQTKTADGVPIQDEVVSPETLNDAIAAGHRVAPDGTQELRPAGDVVSERLDNGRIAASGTSAPRPAPTRIEAPPDVERLPQPPPGPIRQWFADRTLGFRRVFAPRSIDSSSQQVADILREFNGEKANNLARAETAMHDWRSEFDRTPVRGDYSYSPDQPLPHNYQVIDALERNRAALPPRYQKLAAVFDQEFANRIQTMRQFAPNALSHLIENYFPHLWQDPKRAAGVMQQVATRLFAGRKEFLKERSLPIFIKGLERGLKPISDNPVDLLLAKMHSMDKFIAALKAQAEFKAAGKMKFKYALEPMPDGYVKLDDPAFVVHAPPMVTLKEAFDAQLRTRTVELLAKLGVPQKRLATLGGQRWGLAYESPEQIKTRFAGPMSVYWHELGHILDFRYNLQRDFLRQGKSFDDQLRALADARGGENPSHSFKRYLRKGEEKMAVMLEAYTHAPNVFRELAPDVLKKFESFIDEHPELRDIRELSPGLELGAGETTKQLPGILKLGDWIMPDGAAQVIKNYLSPGLAQSGLYRSIRSASNLLNAAQLGLSAFHLGFTSLDAVVNAVEVGLFRGLHGDLGRALKTLAKAPIAPVANYYVGKAIQAAMLDPHAKSIKAFGFDVPISQQAHSYADLAVKAGLRATVDPFWQTHFTRNLTRSIHEGGLAWAKTPLQAPLALVEQAMRPIAEFLVPRQKLGVFSLLVKSEMDRLPANAPPEAVRAALARAADATEDRMGQMTYDNLFYNKVAKDLALLAFRAYGWQLGKYRHLSGAAADTVKGLKQIKNGEMPELTHRQLYFVALPLVVGAVGGLLHYMNTGRRPEDLRDLLHPSTGQLDAFGNEKRLSLPSYLKDLESDWYGIQHGYQMGGPLGVAKGVWEATYHRANPWVSEAVDLLNNRDFYGTQIWNADDPQQMKMLDQAKFLFKGGIPFSITGTMKLAEGEHSARDYILPFVGIVPAKQAISMTPAQAKAAEIIHQQASIGGRTQAQAEHAQVLKEIVSASRSGGAITPELIAQLRKRDLPTIQERFQYTPLQYQVLKMPLRDAMSVFDLANGQERQQLVPLLLKKLESGYKSGSATPEDISRWSQILSRSLVLPSS